MTCEQNEFWDQTVFVQLKAGENSVRFSSEEQPNFDGTSYISDTWKGILLRSQYAPNIDKITVTPAQPGEAEPSTASIALSSATAKVGTAVTVDGSGFSEGDVVTLTLHSDPVDVGTATASADGTFRTTITIPSDTSIGEHTVVATASPSGRSAESALTVIAAEGNGGTGGGTGTGGTAAAVNYQATAPSSSVNVPVGPSASMVAMRTADAAPSSGVRTP
jgi:hypothetical protein